MEKKHRCGKEIGLMILTLGLYGFIAYIISLATNDTIGIMFFMWWLVIREIFQIKRLLSKQSSDKKGADY